MKWFVFVMPLCACIFDCDGTLVDSEPLWHIAEQVVAVRGVTTARVMLACVGGVWVDWDH